MKRAIQTGLGLGVAVLAATTVTGCGSLALGKGQFGCAGQPSDPLCLPTSAVYALTESSEPLQSADTTPERPARFRFRSEDTSSAQREPTALELFTGEATRPQHSTSRSASAPPEPPVAPEAIDEALLRPRSTEPLPLRLPAQVMRIWLAPWEDDRGDLHAGGYVYTEIAPRTWSLAEGPAPATPARLRPLQVAERPAAGPRVPATSRRAPPAAPTPPSPVDPRPQANPTLRSQP
jgi:conjugal transfer pilus assembly protein TraV